MHHELEQQRRLRIRQLKQWKKVLLEYVIITVATLLLVAGVHFLNSPIIFLSEE